MTSQEMKNIYITLAKMKKDFGVDMITKNPKRAMSIFRDYASNMKKEQRLFQICYEGNICQYLVGEKLLIPEKQDKIVKKLQEELFLDQETLRQLLVVFALILEVRPDEVREEDLELYEAAAGMGDVLGQCNLGRIFDFGGETIKRDTQKAMYWYQKAAEAQDGWAINNIGALYDYQKEYKKAYSYYEKAARLGESYSMYSIAWMYQKGNGVGKDIHKAIQWYQKAAEAGDSYSYIKLGDIYCIGADVTRDMDLAMEYYSKAAAHGEVRGYTRIGGIYLMGIHG